MWWGFFLWTTTCSAEGRSCLQYTPTSLFPPSAWNFMSLSLSSIFHAIGRHKKQNPHSESKLKAIITFLLIESCFIFWHIQPQWPFHYHSTKSFCKLWDAGSDLQIWDQALISMPLMYERKGKWRFWCSLCSPAYIQKTLKQLNNLSAIITSHKMKLRVAALFPERCL